MEVTETAAAGLKREFRVVVPATDLEAKVNARLDDLKGRVQLRGFRPGKVPVAHLKRLYGKSAMAEVIEAAVREANSQIVNERGLKLATEPKVVLPPEEGAVEGIIAGKADLAYTVEMEIVPPITLADFKSIKLERLTAAVDDAEIDQALQSIAEQNRPFDDSNGAPATAGDRVTISFQGTIDGAAFEGGWWASGSAAGRDFSGPSARGCWRSRSPRSCCRERRSRPRPADCRQCRRRRWGRCQ